MDVQGPGSIPGNVPLKPIEPASQVRPASDVAPTSETKPVGRSDEVEISPAGKMLDQLHQTSALRADRLDQIRAAIEAGEYETPEKLEAAVEKLLHEIQREDEGR